MQNYPVAKGLSLWETLVTATLDQGSKIALVRSYLQVPQAAGQVKILIFLLKIKFSTIYANIFVMQGKCLFSDNSSPLDTTIYNRVNVGTFGHSRVQLNSCWVHGMSYNISFQMTYRCLYYSRYVLKQFCHENMIKTLINPRYSAFDQTAGTIGQLLVQSDNNKSDAYGRRTSLSVVIHLFFYKI